MIEVLTEPVRSVHYSRVSCRFLYAKLVSMVERKTRNGRHVVVSREHLDHVLRSLSASGYSLIGPTVRDGAIVLCAITSVDQLPAGWSDAQDFALYRLRQNDRAADFDHTVGPHSWKQFLTPPTSEQWHIHKSADGFSSDATTPEAPPVAFIGVRACDLAAIRILDRVYLEGSYRNRGYESRRNNTFIVAVNCTRAGGTCFCSSMGTGPRATGSFDLALTEILTPERHEFVVDVGSQRGARVLSDVPHRDATPNDLDEAALGIAQAEQHMGRQLDTTGLKDRIYQSREHPHWNKVADRCLACGNCTMVCPTCFCSNVQDSTDLCATCSVRTMSWDSCFTLGFSYIHGGIVRKSVAARYRHWMSHKLATWHDQFGTSGCVGCGRCITWCPAQIDITQEAAAINTPPASGVVTQS